MKSIVTLIFSLITITLLIYYIFIRYKFSRGKNIEGKIKDYSKKNNRIREYKVQIQDDNKIINLTIFSNKFYMINSKVKISKYKNRYYSENNLKDIFTKFVIFLILSILLFIFILVFK